MIRLLLADDHAVVRAGVRSILEEHQDLHVVAEASTGDEVLLVLAASPVDVVVLDVSMPGPGVFELLRRLKEEQERGLTIDLGFAWTRLPAIASSGQIRRSGRNQSGCRRSARRSCWLKPSGERTPEASTSRRRWAKR